MPPPNCVPRVLCGVIAVCAAELSCTQQILALWASLSYDRLPCEPFNFCHLHIERALGAVHSMNFSELEFCGELAGRQSNSEWKWMERLYSVTHFSKMIFTPLIRLPLQCVLIHCENHRFVRGFKASRNWKSGNGLTTVSAVGSQLERLSRIRRDEQIIRWSLPVFGVSWFRQTILALN